MQGEKDFRLSGETPRDVPPEDRVMKPHCSTPFVKGSQQEERNDNTVDSEWGRKMKKQCRVTSVNFEVAVLEYLKELQVRDDRDRSYTVNHIIREHAQSHGRKLRSAREPISSRSHSESNEPEVMPEGNA